LHDFVLERGLQQYKDAIMENADTVVEAMHITAEMLTSGAPTKLKPGAAALVIKTIQGKSRSNLNHFYISYMTFSFLRHDQFASA
jgi:uncharacterized protein YjgD (DUF1641 family)